MAQNKYIKNKKDAHEILLEQTQELGFPDDDIEKAFDSDGLVYAVEYYNRHPIKIAYDGSKIHMRTVYEDDNVDKSKILSDFKARYVRGFSKIVQELGSLPFVMFGEYIPERPSDAFVVFDLFVNDNWISHSDLVRIVADNGFRYPRILFHGLYDEDIIRKVMKNVDSDVNEGEKIKYVFVKSEMEAYFGSRGRNRLGAIVSDYIPKKKEDKEELKKARAKASAIMAAYLSALIDASIFAEWKERVGKEGLKENKENKALILSFLVEESLNDMQVDIHQLSEEHNINIDLIEEAIKKQLPRYIMAAFNFK